MIQSIDRAIGILDLFKKHQQLDLVEITELVGLSKSTIHTIINTLVEKRSLKKNESTKKYQLGYSILELGLKQLAELEIYKQAALPLKKLSNNVSQFQNVPFRPISTLGENFNPRNTLSIPVVEISAPP